MAAIKSVAAIRDKYARVTPQRTEDYRLGVGTPRVDWAMATKGAESAYQEGVTSAIARKAFGKGVEKAGTAKWQGRATTVGVDRWGPGVVAGVDAYERGFSPFREVIEKTSLPPRYPSGDPRNYARVQAIGEALRKAKLGGGGR